MTKPDVIYSQSDSPEGVAQLNLRFNLPEATYIKTGVGAPLDEETREINPGHFWLDTISCLLYQKTTNDNNPAGSWHLTDPVNLKGKDGHSFRYGEQNPDVSAVLGNLNDIYICTKTWELWRKTGESNTAWTRLTAIDPNDNSKQIPLCIQGKQGATGPQGLRGNKISVVDQLPEVTQAHISEGIYMRKDLTILDNNGVLYELDNDLNWVRKATLKGNGIKEIKKVSPPEAETNALKDYYQILFTDSDVPFFEYTITNGKDAPTPSPFIGNIDVDETGKAPDVKITPSEIGDTGQQRWKFDFVIPRGPKGDDFTLKIKHTYSGPGYGKEQLPQTAAEVAAQGIQAGDGFIVTNTTTGKQILFACLNPTGATFNEIYYTSGDIKGDTGERGPTGYYFTPSVNADGVLSWTNNGGLNNPTSVNIKGPKGSGCRAEIYDGVLRIINEDD
jgi:hypothetical protein